ncbi:MAG: MurT ligase domain-containing protein [Peptoniphilaceae bacterium]|nr:MurT ligase domain-containing protein [Peptoniphilaceae bacterium]MDY3738659.1 MurT ligase domain-containing protein [Peptoniphilaceae bacterium]
MSIKTTTAVTAAKVTRALLKLMNRGASALPGKVAMKIDSDILSSLSENTKFVFVTGTNGKTMTTSFITNIFRNYFDNVITNDSGANMIQGIVTSLIDNKNSKSAVAVIEVDEANLRIIADYIQPDYIVLTNLFEDQLDRFKSVDNVLNIILDGIKKCPNAKIIANGDLPLFAQEKVRSLNPIYYGVDYRSANKEKVTCPQCGSELKYDYFTYAHLGKFKCENCSLESPQKDYTITEVLDLKPKSAKINIEGDIFDLNVGGIYNVYNAIAAWAVACEMGVEFEALSKGLKVQGNLDGRQEVFDYKGKKVVINLIKNKVGANLILDLLSLDKDDYALYILINNAYADGKDVSWIEELNYDKLKENNHIDNIKISGAKRDYLAEVLTKNGFEFKSFETLEDLQNEIENEEKQKVNVIANYTAMDTFRKMF